ncbi:MAG: hypothetical protein JG777_2206 [Clostridia bacterium]|jgi:uncharacterized integral membrane protein|nr:hypothetical protein [Clostridia bacterium]
MSTTKKDSNNMTENINNTEEQYNDLSNGSEHLEAPNEVKDSREEDRRLYDLTSISECLNVAMNEYNLERNKKQSFDNRAGIIITVFAAIIISIYDKIPITEIIADMYRPLTFALLLQIITGCLIYISLISSFAFAVRIIVVKSSENFDIRIINNELIYAAKIDSVSKFLEIYLNLVYMHRKNNESVARLLALSQWTMIISIILILIYLTIW